MYLSSFTFLIAILPVLLLSYYLIPAKGKNAFLLCCSLLIYGWGSPLRVLYPAACIFYNYGMGLLLERWQKQKILSTALLSFSALLQVAAMVLIRGASQDDASFLFPFGIAVYALQGIGYLIGIYRRRHTASVNLLHLALYLSFFPVLYAGPLMPYAEFSEQIEKHPANVVQLSEGLERFIRGLAEKVVLADTFGYIFRELRQTTQISMLTAWLMTLSFSMYLYFELLGYTEMARGLGKCFGFTLPKNFSQPFFTSSITAFLQSWNISLVLWFQTNFRHFLFGKHQHRKWQKYAALILTWLLIGAWYGQKIQFLLWGLLMGILLTLEQLLWPEQLLDEPLKRKRWYVFGVLYTAVILQFAWVLFFTDSIEETGELWRAMLGFGNGIIDPYGVYFFLSYVALLLLGLYIATDLFRNITERLAMTPFGKNMAVWKPLVHGGLLLFCLASMLYGERLTGLWLRI